MTDCECGCGKPTRLAAANDPRHGHVKGEPVRFLKGHHLRGEKSPEHLAKISAATSGEKNYRWKGNQASYRAIHGWLCKHFPKSGICDECGETKRTSYALIHGKEYTRDRENYREMCHRCHMRYDLSDRVFTAEHRAKISATKRARNAARRAEKETT